jgi:hypothetical protein
LYGVRTQIAGYFLPAVLRVVDVGLDADAVAHGDHHLAFDDGERLQLVLDAPPHRAEAVLVDRGWRLRGQGAREAEGECGEGDGAPLHPSTPCM